MPDAALSAIAKSDRVHRGKVAWRPFHLKTATNGGNESVWNGMPSPRSPDQKGIAISNQLCRLLCSNDWRGHEH